MDRDQFWQSGAGNARGGKETHCKDACPIACIS